MLTFYRNTDDSFTQWVEDKLEEMVVAHKIVDVDSTNSFPKYLNQKSLPVLSDGHEEWTSEEEIKTFLEKLHHDLLLSQSLQSDTCHLDPDNPDECL